MTKKFLTIFGETNKVLLVSPVLFSVLLIPFFGVIPHRDGNIDFVQAHDFHKSGFPNYFSNWSTVVHPPLKLILAKSFFLILGVSPFSYTLIGPVFGILGLVAIFFLIKELFDQKTAGITSLLLATSPLFISTAIFALRDYLVAVLIIISLYYYAKRRYWLYAFAASLLVLTKESGLLLPLSVVFVEFLYLAKDVIKKKTLKRLSGFMFFILPLTTFLFWSLFLKVSDIKPWNDHILSDTAKKGSIYTIIYNLVTFKFLNKYAYQHWKQLFFLNFNWAYWLTVLAGLLIFLSKKTNRITTLNKLNKGLPKTKALFVIVLFSISYLFTVLTFPTYTIPRYALPLIPFLLMAVSLVIKKLMVKYKIITIVLVFTVLISLFYSFDPISIKLWGETEIYGEKIYALNRHLAGNDGITYNIQYLFITKKRTKQIMSIENQEQPLLANECDSIFPDPNNDYQTLHILKFKNLALNPLCKLK